MNPLREQREYAVHEALRREREAWTALEQAARRSEPDDARLHDRRERWQAAAHLLVNSLRALKRERLEQR